MTMPDPADEARSRGGDALEIWRLVGELSSRFIALDSSEVDREIEKVLGTVCGVLGVDSATVWEGPAAAPRPFRLTHVYGAGYGQLDPVGGMNADEFFPWIQDEMLAGRLVAVSSLDELPPEAAHDREVLRMMGAKAGIAIPLWVGGVPVGTVAFNATGREREWPAALRDQLTLLAQVFGGALARKRGDEALRESERRLALAADSAEAGLWTLDRASGEFWISGWTRLMFDYPAERTMTLADLKAVVHADDWAAVQDALDSAMTTADLVQVDYRVVLRDGGVRWLSTRGRSLPAADGRPKRLVGVTLDISDRRRAEEALRASEARLRAGADLAGLTFYDIDYGAATTHMDDSFYAVFGIPPDRREGLDAVQFWVDHIHPGDRERVVERRSALHDGRLERLFDEYRYLHPDEGERWMQHIALVTERGPDGRVKATNGVLRDITDLKRAEQELHDLSRRLLTAQEQERALLARELHDDVSQRLAVLAIDVGRAQMEASEGVRTEVMASLHEGLARLSEDVHSLAYQLHPSVLEELGLAEALRAECERRGRRADVALSVDVGPLPAHIPDDAALCLFRVAQEALSNVLRHAAATSAVVRLREQEDGLLLAVTDDGRGFAMEGRGTGRRLGLASMRERVRLVDGSLDIESEPGHGTAVVAWVPLRGGEGT